MNSGENIENIIKKFDVDVNPEKDREILDKIEKEGSAFRQTSAWRVLVKSRVTQMAFAAAIIIILSLFWFVVNDNDKPQLRQSDRLVAAAENKTPSELVSVVSLNMIFRNGDMKAVERQFEQAEKKVLPTLRESIVLDQLISEL